MTPNQAREILYEAFTSGWNSTSIPFTFDDEEFNPPAKTPCWVRFVVRHMLVTQDTLGPPGGRKFAASGRIYLQVFVPRGSAKKDSDAAVLTFKGIMEAKQLSGINTFSATPRELGDDANGWDQTSVEVPFTYYDTK